MARSPVPTSLVHDRAQIARDAHQLDQASAAIAPALAPFARDALLAITAETIAEDLVAPAADAVASMLEIADGRTVRSESARAGDALARAVREALPPIDDEAANSRAFELAECALVAWSATLHHALAETSNLSLTDGVYADDEAREHLVSLAHNEGITHPAAFYRAVRDALFDGRNEAALPGGLHLERAHDVDGSVHVVVTRTRDADESVAPEVARSGERTRDDAPPHPGIRRVRS